MIYLLSIFFILGSAVGSFLNVVVDRLVRGEGIFLGRSYCDYCHATLQTVDLVPIVSFVGLGGRCRRCHKPISWQYPIVETISGALFAAFFYQMAQVGNLNFVTLAYILTVASILIVVSVVDIKYSLIPTTLVYLGSTLALFYDYFTLASDDFVQSVLVAFVLAVAFSLVVVITRGRGMGTGDIPLVFMLGLVLGWPQALVGVFLAFVLGACFALFLIAIGWKKFGQTVPFAPFLTLGALAAFFVGSEFLSWYLGLW